MDILKIANASVGNLQATDGVRRKGLPVIEVAPNQELKVATF